jgi:hypothetical protein
MLHNGEKKEEEHRGLSCLETTQRLHAVGFSTCVMLQQLEFDVVNFNAGGSRTRHDTNDAVYRHYNALLHHVAHIGHACASRSWRYSRQLEQAAATECLDPEDTPTSCLKRLRRICQRRGQCLVHAGLVHISQRRESKWMEWAAAEGMRGDGCACARVCCSSCLYF